jgi:hypothetical protein
MTSLVSIPASSQWAIPPQSVDIIGPHGRALTTYNGTTATAAWPTANLIIYVPVAVRISLVCRKLWVVVQATGTGNIDIGLYNAAGTRLVNSGTTAHGVTGGPKFFDVTDTPLNPGLYYIAVQQDNNTDTYERYAPAIPLLAASGVLSEATTFGLPATATWTVDSTLAFMPIVGLLRDATLA